MPTEPSPTPGTEETLAADPQATPPGMATSAWLRPGARVGRYLVLDRLGSGGMGIVYSAYDPELDRKVAIKLLRPVASIHTQPMDRAFGAAMHRLFGDTPPTAEPRPDPDQQRLLREAQATAQLSHPNVVTVHDVGEHDGHVFVAMEFVQGCTLREWLARERRSWQEVVAVFLAAGAGLAAAHEKALVHRDFKPDNVMIADDGRVRVMDFGLVRPSGSSERESTSDLQPTIDALGLELTGAGAVLGTPAYMSPEQYAGGVVDHLSDQFGFCIALWEGIYRARPFRGSSVVELGTAVTSGELVEPPRDVGLPGELHRVLTRGLAVEPSARYPSMRELLADLARDPSRRRRRTITAGVVVLGIAGLAGGWSVDRARKLAACRSEGDAIASVWGPAAAARVEAGLLASGPSYAAATHAKLTPWLDEYAERWAELRTAACTSIALDRPEATVAARTVDCLDARTVRLGELVELLAGADEMTTRKAVAMAAGLPPLDQCEDEAFLLRRAARADDPAEVRALDAELERAAALQSAGKFAEAQAIVASTIAAATELGADRIVATARYDYGTLFLQQGDYEAAERELTEAVFAAAAIDEPVGTARSAVQLAYVIAYYLARPKDAELWIRWAHVLVTRLETGEELVGAALRDRLGMIEFSRGHRDQALALLQESLATKEAVLGKSHPEIAITLNNLAIVQTDNAAMADALASIERSLAITEDVQGPIHPDVASCLTNLAQLRFRTGDLPAARAAMERAIGILEATLAPGHLEIVKARGNLATVLHVMGADADARELLQQTATQLAAALGPDHPTVAKTLINLGNVERGLGDAEAALAHHRRALAIQERVLEPGNVSFAEAFDAIGEDLRSRGDHDEALRYFQRGLAILQAAGGSNFEPIALYHVGISELDRGRPKAAVEPLAKAVALFEARGLEPGMRAEAEAALARARNEVSE